MVSKRPVTTPTATKRAAAKKLAPAEKTTKSAPAAAGNKPKATRGQPAAQTAKTQPAAEAAKRRTTAQAAKKPAAAKAAKKPTVAKKRTAAQAAKTRTATTPKAPKATTSGAPAAKKTTATTRTPATTARRSATKTAKTATSAPRQPATAAEKAVAPRLAGRKPAAGATQAPVAAPLKPLRRTVFIDVENTSDEAELIHALDKLAIDRTVEQVEIIAVGNWRVAGQRMGRRLAGMGAQLVHSAPITGVRDWSDLWIAVAAGMRLGRAMPGDVLEIISDDKAFDAVGDTAASLGIVFHRIALHVGRTGVSTASTVERASAVATKAPRRRRRGGRGGARKSAATAAAAAATPQVEPGERAERQASPPPAPQVRAQASRSHAPQTRPVPTAAPAHADAAAEPHTATHEQIRAVIERLAGGDHGRWVNLDVLTNALKKEGFSRPPGSPRLVTRLRKFADVEISANGAVRLASPGGES